MFELYVKQMRVFAKSLPEEILYLIIGGVLGYSLHRVAALYVKNTSKNPNQLSPDNQNRRYRRFIRLITRWRGGEIVAYTFASIVKTVIETCAADMVGTVIGGVAGGLLTYLGKNPHLISDASLSGVTQLVLRPVHAGVLVGLDVLTINCLNIPGTVVALTSLEVNVENAEDQLEAFLDEVELMTQEDKLYFIICLITILLYLYKVPGLRNKYFMVLRRLQRALRENKISKSIYRLIMRRLRRHKVPVDIFPAPISMPRPTPRPTDLWPNPVPINVLPDRLPVKI